MTYKLGPTQRTFTPKSDENNFHLDGWAVHRTEEGYEVSFVAAAHGGGVIRIKIDEEGFEAAKNGEVTLEETLKKYDPNRKNW